MRVIAFLLAVALAAPAAAQPVQIDEATWVDAEAPRPKLIDIALPRRAGPMLLTRLRAYTPAGTDNSATYASPDALIQGTVYIYRPGYPDPSYTLLMTAAAIENRFAGATAGPEELVSVAGVPALHRKVWIDGAAPPQFAQPGKVTTIAGALRAGSWIAKFRVTGPMERREEALAAFDALVAGLRFGKDVRLVPSALDEIGRCPEAEPKRRAKRLKEDPMPMSLMIITTLNIRDPAKPAQSRKLCEIGRKLTDNESWIALGEAGANHPAILLLGDSGDAIVTTPPVSEAFKGWGLALATRDRTQMFGPFSGAAPIDQMLGVLEAGKGWAGPPISRFERDSDDKFVLKTFVP